MTDPDNVARFLLKFVLFTRCFKVNIFYWTPMVMYTSFVTGTPSGANPLTVAILSAKLKQLGQYTVTL